jgi:hypothetical protein
MNLEILLNKDILRKFGFSEEIKAVEHGFCPLCKQPISKDSFIDELSKKEYKISGLCQKCQDEMFEE